MPLPVFYRDKSFLFDEVTLQPNETVTSENLRIRDSEVLLVQIQEVNVSEDEEGDATSINGRLRTKPETDEPFGTTGAVIRTQDLTEDPDNCFNEDFDVENHAFMQFRITNNGAEPITINGKAFTDGKVTDV